jgi:hypothetical protein
MVKAIVKGETERPKSPSLTATACSSTYGNGLFVAVANTARAGDDFGPIPRKWLQLMKGDPAGDLRSNRQGIRGGLVPEAPRCRSAMRRLTG